ncbi:hypothetical protein HDC30_003128 [Pseudomonas sp. JAI115]|uniref:hypothetical protein n=1 Tax=Pseudomonas sp. JAI115 TaxID=2723061 RepID=UPI0016077D91|nr:hypothetical protein [Pseudomonas sp. JAI115]MBB6155904.1 hypothetical protein [Pseudomonas sp. JAI115]
MSFEQPHAPITLRFSAAAELVQQLGEVETLRVIEKLCVATLLRLKLRQSIQRTATAGHNVTAAVEDAAFVHGLPLCCVWRIVDRPLSSAKV